MGRVGVWGASLYLHGERKATKPMTRGIDEGGAHRFGRHQQHADSHGGAPRAGIWESGFGIRKNPGRNAPIGRPRAVELLRISNPESRIPAFRSSHLTVLGLHLCIVLATLLGKVFAKVLRRVTRARSTAG